MPSCLPHRAFTLIEVMLSLFIVLLLLLGVNAVFRVVSDTIKAGNALGEATRNGRAVQPILFNDLNNCAPDSPAFIITSCVVPQYLNAADAKASQNQPNGGLPQSGCILSDHMHRADMLMFFERGLFSRKTANAPSTGQGYLVSSTTSDEAYVHYGHLRIAADGATFVGPDDYAGSSEPYASDWVLGRNVILMSDPSVLENAVDLPSSQYDSFFQKNSSAEGYYTAANPTTGTKPYSGTFSGSGNSGASNVAPLGWGSPDTTVNGKLANQNQVIQTSRYDLAGATIDQFRGIVTAAANVQAGEKPSGQGPPAYYTWWAPLVYEYPFNGEDPAVVPYPSRTYAKLTPSPISKFPFPTFTSPYPQYPASPTGGEIIPRFRFQASSALSANPFSSLDQANLSPYFLEHVSQFVVEFAGDFTTQDSFGNVTDTVPDGQIDWMYATKGDWQPTTNYSPGDFVINRTSGAGQYCEAVKPVLGTPPANPAWLINVAPPKQIRWYGMPRDSSGSGNVYSSYYVSGTAFASGHFNIRLSDPYEQAATPSVTIAQASELNNVVPLVDVWRTSLNNPTRPVPYEVEDGPTLLDSTIPTNNIKSVTDYAASVATNPTSVPAPTGMSPMARYTAVWRNDVPAMVRILIKVDDPNNALQNGPWSEYVFKLK